MAACDSAVRLPVGVDATTKAQAPAPLSGHWAPSEEPAWFRSAVAAAFDAALAPAVTTAVGAALAASSAPGGALHSLFTVSSHNNVARAQNNLRAASGAPLMPLQSATGDIAPGFPATEAALMSLKGRALGELLTFYGQPVPAGANSTATRKARLAAFRQFIGLY